MKSRSIGLLVLISVVAGLALAQNPVSRPTPPNPEVLRQRRLDFLATRLSQTDSQRQQATSIFAAADDSSKPLMENLRDAHESLAGALKSSSGEDKIDSLAAGIGNLLGLREWTRLAHPLRCYAGVFHAVATESPQGSKPMGLRRSGRSNAYIVAACLFLAACATLPQARAQTAEKKDSIEQLNQFSSSIQALADKVSPSVVRVLVTRYAPRQESDRTSAVVGRQQSLGSGVIVDPDGYIMTNAHVVEGAQRIRVNLVPKGDQTIPSVVAHSFAPPKDAILVGIFEEGDLALLKIAATGLPALPFADYRKLRQGQVVFAFGSPEGLQDSMSMGIVSSIARQPDPDSPFLYIQTDAPINPGSSGGPLINTAGEIVGLDTFIVTQAGGSEGIGFAVPSMLVHWVFEQLRKYGHVHRPIIGVGLQTITPTLAAAVKLPRGSGVVVSDVLPGSPAESVALKINDVLLSADGRPLDSVPALMGVCFAHGRGEHIKLQVLRGNEELSFDIAPVEEQHQADRLADFADSTESLIPKLGVLGIAIDKRTAAIVGDLRRASGVIVAARLEDRSQIDTGLRAGDVIHEVNGNFVLSVDALRSAVAQLKQGDPVALLIERGGKLLYVAFAME